MSVKGFVINGQTVKYNYPDLDNLPSEPSGGGVTEALKTALLQLASKVAYIDDDGADYYQDLYDALYESVTTYTISNFLTAVINSNSASTIVENSSYMATLSCAADYEITSVTVTMGGNDVTGTSYSSGTISIANVTGNIVITAVATQRQATLSSIDAVFSQGSAEIYTTTPLNDLKQYLVVTATWSDTTTSTVPSSDYTLSGTLSAGTSAITVSYGGKTDTFSVTVTAAPLYQLANGTHTFTNSPSGYVTISNHNHIEAQRTVDSGTNYNFCNLSDLDGNGTTINATTNINNKTAIFSLQANDVVRFVVSNVTGDFDDYTIGLRKAGGTTSVAAVSGQTTDVDDTVTVASSDSVGCLFLYFGTQNGTNKDITCDIAVYVNGTQYF